MRIDWTWASMDKVLAWAEEMGTWRRNVRNVGMGQYPGGEVDRHVVDVVIPPEGPTYSADASRRYPDPAPSDGQWRFALLAIESFRRLVIESDEARALLGRVRDQLDAESAAEVDQLLGQSTVRSEWDGRNSSGF